MNKSENDIDKTDQDGLSDTGDKLISAIAHELRTPLTTLHGYIQLLAKRFEGVDSAESKWISEMQTESNRMISLISDLLDANRIRKGQFKYELREVDINQVIKESVDYFMQNHPSHRISLTNKLSVADRTVIGDYDRLVQVVRSILNNAAKFTPISGQISIELKVKQLFLVVKVRDSGEGIQSADLKNVFESFYKGKNRRGGIGVGLYLAKNIIENHRGSIMIRSKVNKGTTVEFKLPQAKLTL